MTLRIEHSRKLTRKPEKVLTIDYAREVADSLHIHARCCKRPLADCQACAANVQWFAGLPLPLLSQVLEERPKQ